LVSKACMKPLDSKFSFNNANEELSNFGVNQSLKGSLYSNSNSLKESLLKTKAFLDNLDTRYSGKTGQEGDRPKTQITKYTASTRTVSPGGGSSLDYFKNNLMGKVLTTPDRKVDTNSTGKNYDYTFTQEKRTTSNRDNFEPISKTSSKDQQYSTYSRPSATNFQETTTKTTVVDTSGKNPT